MRQHSYDDEGWRAPGTDSSAALVDGALGQLSRGLESLAGLPLGSLSDDEVERLLVSLTRLSARVAAATSVVAVEADRRCLGDRIGARRTSQWWARQTRLTRGESARLMALARSLDSPFFAPVRDALASGDVLVDQAHVIVRAVEDLPDRISAPQREQARDHLLKEARDHDARDLRLLGRRILDVIAPEIAESEEQKRLEDEERRAVATSRITFVDDGHGRVHGRFVLPTLHGLALKQMLLAFADPRRHPDEAAAEQARDPKAAWITPEQMGRAFIELIERYPTDGVPRHGGGTASLTVLIDHDRLVSGLGAATLPSGHRISAGEARRLACSHKILPAVLGGDSEVLDLGRARRLASGGQSKALVVRDQGCTVEGCGAPADICHAHHDTPWSEGGATDLRDLRLLCPHHHSASPRQTL